MILEEDNETMLKMKSFIEDSNSVFNDQERGLQAFLADALLFLFHSKRTILGAKEQGSPRWPVSKRDSEPDTTT